jgi:NADPH:quinone reductase-like Zn-dependent oxidoreductase
MESQNFENTYVTCENGKWLLKQETISSQAPEGHVLVKVAYSTCNPYDDICYKIFKTENSRLGAEGCGVIISVGQGVDQAWLNKKVAFTGEGCWTNYKLFELSKSYLIPLEDS